MTDGDGLSGPGTRDPVDGLDDSGTHDPAEYDGPSVDVPAVDPPSVDVPKASSEAVSDSPLTTLFVLHVIVWNAVLLLASLGTLLIVFEGTWNLGGSLLGAAGILALYGVYRWPEGVGWRP